jgi:TonB family protein
MGAVKTWLPTGPSALNCVAMLPLSLLLLLALAPVSAPDLSLENQLRQEYLGSQRLLHHFYAADTLKFNIAGEPLNQERTIPWTLAGAVVIEKVTLERQKLELQGHRRLVTFDHQHKQLTFTKLNEKIWIEVATSNGPDQARQLRSALAKVFADVDDLPSLLPEYWRDYMTRFLGKQSGGCEERQPHATAGVASQPVAITSRGVSPGHLIKKAEPYYLPIARKAGIEGDVQLRAVISKTGLVTDICIVKALGAGLDDSLIAAVRQWQYSPYLLNGEPVEIQTSIKTTFHQ